MATGSIIASVDFSKYPLQLLVLFFYDRVTPYFLFVLGALILLPNPTMLPYVVKSQLPRTCLCLPSLLKDSSQESPPAPPLPPLQLLASLLILQINFLSVFQSNLFHHTKELNIHATKPS